MPDQPDWLDDQFDDWGDRYVEIYEDMAHGTDALNDPMLQALYDAAFVDIEFHGADLTAVREALYDYVQSEYGYAFEDYFDWEAWREAYGSSE